VTISCHFSERTSDATAPPSSVIIRSSNRNMFRIDAGASP
jgi:hypothetical protein